MKILVADDDELIRELLCDILKHEKYQVEEASNGIEVLDVFQKNQDIALILLDIMMPFMDGMKVLKRIREFSDIPVIFLTALSDNINELRGFELGACDYIRKPFHKDILLARIHAALAYKNTKQEEKTELLSCGKLLLDVNACKVFVEEKEIDLTNKEYQLLTYLMENKNIVLKREQILEKIWGYDYEGDVRTIDTHIKMLRMDLGICGNYIRTVRGIGYTFELEETK